MRFDIADESALRDHIFSTYLTLRFGMAVLAIAFPPLLWGVGALLYGIDLQPSMSHYYFAQSADLNAFPMRVWFVGLLFAIGACLYLYKGFTKWENGALNAAGAFAALVALYPMNVGCKGDCGSFSLHGTFAVSLFLCLAFVSVFCAKATLDYLAPELRDKYRRAYNALGAAMVVSPVAALLLTTFTGTTARYTFFAEAFGVWAFAAYWWVKSREMAISGAEKRALKGELMPPKRQSGTVLPTFKVEGTDKPKL